jgi:hypothetical protein
LYSAGTLIPLETLVSGVVRISSIILSGVVLWFATPPAFRWLKERFITWRNAKKPHSSNPSQSKLQSAHEPSVIFPIAEDRVMVKIEKDY